MIDINYIAVLVSGIVVVVIGFAWYSQALFGKKWIALSKIDMSSPEAQAEAKKSMGPAITVSIIASLVMSWILAWYISATNTADVVTGISHGFWLWLGFIFTVMSTSKMYERKPWALVFINSGYWLVGLLIAGAILSVWK